MSTATLSLWSSVRFYRSESSRGVWVLSGIPSVALPVLLSRLFVLGAGFVAAGSPLSAPGGVWVAFKVPRGLAARLASIFPAPNGVAPLIISGSRVLSGVVEKEARLTIRLRPGVVARRGWLVQSDSPAVAVEVLPPESIPDSVPELPALSSLPLLPAGSFEAGN